MDNSGVGVTAWQNHTTIHPVGLIATLLLGSFLVVGPRRYAIVPMLLMACLIPTAQRLMLMGADFTLLRILVLFAWFRLLIRNEFHGFVWNRLDSLVVAWSVSGTIIYTASYGTQSALVYRCGVMFDTVGMYFFFRCILREWADFEFLIRAFILTSFPVAMAFIVERATGRNIFAVFGGVAPITWVRDGKLRCQGAYSHPILAGCFWVIPIPWIISEVAAGRKYLGVAGVGAALVVVLNCASSTPLLGVGFMILGMLLYFVRAHLRALRWSFLLLLVLLHLSMQKPVWHLLARVDLVGGSTGWHRYKIMDAAINNFSEWWLLGETNPMSWGVWQMRDITNQYIIEALRGGLLTLVCFIAMISVAFGLVGSSLRSCEGLSSRRVLVWSTGAALFSHVCIFFSVSYFGQIEMLWYLTLGMIGSLPGMSYGSSPMPTSSALLGNRLFTFASAEREPRSQSNHAGFR
ncbi:MAG: hypothetical protein ABL921_34515 [Pirellula sp.]